VYFKTNRNFIKEFPNMSSYVKDLYSNPGVQPVAESAHACCLHCRLSAIHRDPVAHFSGVIVIPSHPTVDAPFCCVLETRQFGPHHLLCAPCSHQEEHQHVAHQAPLLHVAPAAELLRHRAGWTGAVV